MILFIHRKDLRTTDLPAFDAICSSRDSSLHVLILEPFLLRNERYLEHSGQNFLIHLSSLQQEYKRQGKLLHILYGEADQILMALAGLHPIHEVRIHADYTPYALKRDRLLRDTASALNIRFHAHHDSMLCDMDDFMEWSGRKEPYKVFTPFYRRWRSFLAERFRPPYSTGIQELQTADLHPQITASFPVPDAIARQLTLLAQPARAMSPRQALEDFLQSALQQYPVNRDQYALDGTSRISRHLNTGAISVRTVYSRLTDHKNMGEEWVRQLAWRDFYQYQARLDPDFFNYENIFDLSALGTHNFGAWSSGTTGIPVIDAAMRQLNETGWMPNRLRMITAMFLTKNLGCPFIYGERYFRLKLSDYDNILNRGGWLWSSSLGFDASPYFRVMNPVTQSQTHNPSGSYIRTWIPELAEKSDKAIHLPRADAIVDLKRSRALALELYKDILRSKGLAPQESMPWG
ncbi:deoxyribodipyrimidine photo-lyase [Paenibacillus sp. MMS20-IR301]|uniref:cryptochrome/photolyase family protein n=1 Tax=Paenibacillus sp. MMS20-IR301 TaxID=2895946 RepID=UPI0028E67D6B|nr:deoxyribodipyrimidine photo-lyase [Paenibacillus sp. MMS20-IR301]WNS45573.1 deoxyribodipyrimidine photo-lyase [Paenibacillus sp. MMS20-IR301]